MQLTKIVQQTKRLWERSRQEVLVKLEFACNNMQQHTLNIHTHTYYVRYIAMFTEHVVRMRLFVWFTSLPSRPNFENISGMEPDNRLLSR